MRVHADLTSFRICGVPGERNGKVFADRRRSSWEIGSSQGKRLQYVTVYTASIESEPVGSDMYLGEDCEIRPSLPLPHRHKCPTAPAGELLIVSRENSRVFGVPSRSRTKASKHDTQRLPSAFFFSGKGAIFNENNIVGDVGTGCVYAKNVAALFTRPAYLSRLPPRQQPKSTSHLPSRKGRHVSLPGGPPPHSSIPLWKDSSSLIAG